MLHNAHGAAFLRYWLVFLCGLWIKKYGQKRQKVTLVVGPTTVDAVTQVELNVMLWPRSKSSSWIKQQTAALFAGLRRRTVPSQVWDRKRLVQYHLRQDSQGPKHDLIVIATWTTVYRAVYIRYGTAHIKKIRFFFFEWIQWYNLRPYCSLA